MNSLWPSKGPQDPPTDDRPTGDVADTGDVAATAVASDDDQASAEAAAAASVPAPALAPSPALPLRPALQRNAMQAAPPGPAPMPPPTNKAVPGRQMHAPTDSLSLQQVKRIVEEMNRPEPLAYDFTYEDMGPPAEEIDEWFGYHAVQWARLDSAQRAFDWHWEHEASSRPVLGWDDADHESRARFVRSAIAGIQSNDAALRSASIGKLVYLVLGRWVDTAIPGTTEGSTASASQLKAIKAGVECLASLDGLPVVWEALQSSFEVYWSGDALATQETQDELLNLMTILYVALQETLNDPEDMASTYNKLLDLNPSLVDFMMKATMKLRWDEQGQMPQTQIFLLFWKSILLVFGGIKDIDQMKKAVSEMSSSGKEKQLITASPLDYHVFRQEITSKYPAYVPPRPPIPLEADNTSLLPPLPNQSSRNNGQNGILPAPPNAQTGGASILHQPVHIATPAPSPPPSPAVGGKGGKKQNYQTNQNFPFMYPPLDATSNSAGGKGPAGIHDAVVSRKWEGSDIPASILEAGRLFSERVRMTRATRQLWDEREKFLKSERGWDRGSEDDDDDEIEGLDLNELTAEEKELIKEAMGEDKEDKPLKRKAMEVDFGPKPENLSERDKRRLQAVENFYALPHLQSLVIVLLRPIVANATAMAAQQPQGQAQGPGRPGAHPITPGLNGGPQKEDVPEPLEMLPEEMDATRTREITAKAMTGILLLLLKWLRVSHILKFEYFTQLLLDSNYVLLVLKLFAHQDIQQVVDSKMNRPESSFFHFCDTRSRYKSSPEEERPDPAAEESEDEAAPPPIRRQRPEPDESAIDETEATDEAPARPEFDELGYPINAAQPMEPIKDFSRRNFFSLINYLRIMQKVCKNKAHRNLLLVQYKSSAILRKSLRVPQPELRLYTLKLFKNQVPYCGRKWRQSNMRVITAVYLHCRPELRDEWLAGSDVDAEVDAALPWEQGLRALTHWHNVRGYYPGDGTQGGMAKEIGEAMRGERRDWFARELGKLDITWNMADGDESGSEMDHVEGWA